MSESDRLRLFKTFVEQQTDLLEGEIRIEKNLVKKSAEGLVARDTSEPRKNSLAWFFDRVQETGESWSSATSLADLESSINNCTKCELSKSRDKLVFGTGAINAELVVIGEAPGAEENLQGRPFVGRAGNLLTKMLTAVEFDRSDVFICNILKSRPPENRRPEASEVEACLPYLYKQIALIQPKIVLALGLTAAKALLGVKAPMKELRGKMHDWRGLPVMITYHPAALLRNPSWKRSAWEDLQALRREHDRLVDKS